MVETPIKLIPLIIGFDTRDVPWSVGTILALSWICSDSYDGDIQLLKTEMISTEMFASQYEEQFQPMPAWLEANQISCWIV